LIGGPTSYKIQYFPGLPGPTVLVAGALPSADAARMDRIGLDRNADKPFGNQWILLFGGGFTLDGLELKHVVFRDVHVGYDGGPIEMEDVYFFNCTFDLRRTVGGENLAVAFLNAEPSINNFKVG
jgi:hypothetical protein